MKLLSYRFFGISLLFLISFSAFSDTRIFYNSNGIANVVTRSMDYFEDTLTELILYPRGIKKVGSENKNSIVWISRYGSIVTTAYHRSMAIDGMNEYGLAAHLFPITSKPTSFTDRHVKTLSQDLLVEYVLDNFKTVSEFIQSLQTIQIIPSSIHGKKWSKTLVVEDETGDSAIVEFADRMIIYQGKSFQVVTGHYNYQQLIKMIDDYQSFGGKKPIPSTMDNIGRYVRASYYLKNLPQPKNYIEASVYVLSVLKSVMIPFNINQSEQNTDWPTRWFVAADLTNRYYYFNPTSQLNNIYIDLKQVDFNQGKPVLTFDPTDILLNNNDIKFFHKKKSLDLFES